MHAHLGGPQHIKTERAAIMEYTRSLNRFNIRNAEHIAMGRGHFGMTRYRAMNYANASG